MAKKSSTKPSPKKTDPPKDNRLEQSVASNNHKRIIYFFFGILVLLALAFVFEVPLPLGDKQVATTPTVIPSPTPTPASPSAAFVPYGSLSGQEKFAVAANFTDPILNVSFAYAPGYHVQSFKADDMHKNAGVFFVQQRLEDIELISDAIDCELDNREEPGEVCREGVLGDVEVSIVPYTVSSTVDNIGDNCRKEIDSKERTLVSCEEQLSLDADTKGMVYMLYLFGENPLAIQVSSKDPKTHAHLIRSIISSAANNLP
jgi:hypothetical protein